MDRLERFKDIEDADRARGRGCENQATFEVWMKLRAVPSGGAIDVWLYGNRERPDCAPESEGYGSLELGRPVRTLRWRANDSVSES